MEQEKKPGAESPDKAPRVLEPVRISQEVADEMALMKLEDARRALLPSETILSAMTKFAAYCAQTGQMPATIDTAAKAIMVFQAGRELGIPPMKSLYSFYFVNNKLSMYGPTVIERVRQWAKIEYGTCDDKQATVTITRKDDGTKLSNTVTMADLERRGITMSKYGKKDTYVKHAKTMLLYKAVGEIVRHIVPEALGAMGMEGDFSQEEIKQKERIGKLAEEKKIEPKSTNVPSVKAIVRDYDMSTIARRLAEFGEEVDETMTKHQLAERLHEVLEQKINHGKEETEAGE